MTIQFNQIPGNLRVPFLRFEVNAGASPYQSISRLLLIGQMLPTGSATPNVPIYVSGGAGGLFGFGSQLQAMYDIAVKNAPFQEIWALPVSDASGATKASGTITLSAAAPVTTPGSIVLYVGGVRISVPVDTTMTQAIIAADIIAAINTCTLDMQATAAVGVVGVAASGTVTASGTATTAGVASVTINGTVYSAAVAVGQTAAQVAASIASAVANQGGYAFTATSLAAVATITAESAGATQNGYVVSSASTAAGITLANTPLTGGTNTTITVTVNNAGTLGNGVALHTALGVSDGSFTDQVLTITQMANGAGDPSLTTALANLGDDLWDFIAMPWAQSYQMDQLDALLASRWGPMSQTYGTYYTAMVNQTAGQVMAYTVTRNGQFGSMMPMNNSPQPAYLIAAAYAAQAAQHLQDAPELSRPLQTVQLVGILPPKYVSNRWTVPQRQSFYYAGASGFIVDSGGNVLIDRAVTLYQKDAWGNPDQSWLDVNTLAQLMYGMRYISSYVTETYPRSALVTSNPNNLQGFVTPQDIANAMVHAYSGLVNIGVFQDVATFQSLLIVEANAQDPNRVDTFLPVEAVNGLRVLAINATSFLQYPNNA